MSGASWRDAGRRLRADRAAMIAVGILAAAAVLALIGPWLNANSPETIDWRNVAVPPTLRGAHWLGTDRLGRDLFARTMGGVRVSLLVGLAATAISLGIGIGYGAVAGYLGGRTDDLLMRIVEILDGLPLIFFVIFLTVIFGRGEWLLFASIGAVGWLAMARIVRGQTLSIRRREYIEAARASGAGTARIIWTHVVPNVAGPVAVYATLTIPQIMLFESFLSFLGLGVQEPRASLGSLIAEGAGEMQAAPWILLGPGICLAALLVALNVLGDGLRDALEPGER